MRVLILILFSLVFVNNLLSQNFTFDRITTSEGLSQNDINDIYQDKNGFLWICTNDGLNRYDGYNFKTYRSEPYNDKGLGTNLIYKITEDSEGNIWIGTPDKGTYRFNVKTETFTHLNELVKEPHDLSFDYVTCLVVTKNDNIWLGSNNGIGLYRKTTDSYEFQRISNKQFPQLNSLIITDLAEDIYGRVWVGTQTGLYIFSENDGQLEIKTVNGGSYVKDIYIKDNTYVVAYTEGVFFLEFNAESLTNFKAIKVADENAISVLVTESQDLFVGNYQGLHYHKKLQFRKYSYKEPEDFSQNWEIGSLSKNIITKLFEDKTGIVWIGTNGGGLNKFNPKQKKFRHYAKTKIEGSLSYNKIRAIYEDSSNNIWIGTEGGGLNFLSHSENKNFASGFLHYDVNTSENQNHVYSIIEFNDRVGKTILAGSGYPSIVNLFSATANSFQVKNNLIFEQITNSPFCSVKDRFGNLWLGTYGSTGLYKYSVDESGNEKLKNYRANGNSGSLSSNVIRSLLEDSYGNIWVGTDKGLNLLQFEEQEKENPKFHVYLNDKNDLSSLSNNYILPMFQSSDKNIWIGTLGGGLNKVLYHNNPDSIRFEAITTKDGLPNNVIKGILEDDYGFLWVSSNKGLTRYGIEDKVIINYDVSDGLQDNEFGELACCKLSDGEMLFGGVNGFNAFYPKDIVRDMTPPEIAFTDFQILNKTIKPGEKINGRVPLKQVINYTNEVKLKYAQNSFAIYFASLHFSAPQKNTYKYMLEGFDSDWIRKDASDRIAKYTNLNPGKYVFKVMASNNDGIWNSESKNLVITITAPWYLSFVAWLVYVALFLTGLWFFQRYSLIRIHQKNELIMERFEKEKIKELSQMKLRFFTNISHEFRTPLTLIIGPLEKLIKQGEYDKKTNDSFSIMHRNASILLRLINQLVDFRKFEQGKMKLNASEANIVPFLKDVYNSFSELANDKNINYSFSSSSKNINIWFDGDKLERIMYNLLSNAFKFTPEGGEIEVMINENDFDISIDVIDTGVGISKEYQKHIFERFYQAKQIKNRKIGSTGIGLSFIKGLVELHKGEISFVSNEGEGTTFTVKLKKGSNHLSAGEMSDVIEEINTDRIIVPKPVITTQVNDKDSDNTNKSRVLIIEDNFELRKFIKDSLKAKYKIALAENGKEGLEKAYEFNPEVIVSDIMMPEMSGFELCEAVKSDTNISHIPVILLTARSTAENRIKGYKLGADAYISKPFEIEVLDVRIQNLIQSRKSLQQKIRKNILVEPSEVTTTSMDEKFLKRMLHIIEENISNPEYKVSQLAAECGMSQINLNRKIKSLTGQTPKIFIRSIRLKRAAQLLTTSKYNVSEIAYEVGFLDIKYFRGCFKDEFGKLPSEFKNINSSGT